MSKKLRVILTVILVIIAVLAWFTYSQWNNISAVLDAIRYSNEDVLKMESENKETVQKFLEEEEGIVVRDLTEEESKALTEGNLTEEEVVELLTGTKQPEEATQPKNPETLPEKPPEEVEPVTKPAEKDSSQIIAEQIAKLYIQKSTYLNKLDDIEAQVRKEFADMGLKTNEERKKAKSELLNKYLPMVAQWEKDCDSVVYGIIDVVRDEIIKSGKDTLVADKLEEAYLSEKRTKKAYFINRYMD